MAAGMTRVVDPPSSLCGTWPYPVSLPPQCIAILVYIPICYNYRYRQDPSVGLALASTEDMERALGRASVGAPNLVSDVRVFSCTASSVHQNPMSVAAVKKAVIRPSLLPPGRNPIYPDRISDRWPGTIIIPCRIHSCHTDAHLFTHQRLP